MLTPLIEFKSIHKKFSDKTVLNNVSLSCNKGTITGVVGENGAGKSTLMKILMGELQVTYGEILLKNQQLKNHSPKQAKALGLAMIHQHFSLIGEMTVLENLQLATEIPRFRIFFRSNNIDKIESYWKLHSPAFSLTQKVKELTIAQQQQLEIIRCLIIDCEILVLDEPTAVLSPPEVDHLFSQLKILKEKGVTLFIVTHKISEVLRITDQIAILRAGVLQKVLETKKTNPDEVAKLMIGEDTFSEPSVAPQSKKSMLINLKLLNYEHFQINRNEILGVCGVVGSGQTKLIQELSKLKKDSNIKIELVPEDRHRLGIIPDFSAAETFYFLSHLRHGRWFKNVNLTAGLFLDWATRLRIVPQNVHLSIGSFSGGNQQKIFLASCLSKNPDLLVASYPTRGVDFNATQLIHGELKKFAHTGGSVLLISADLDEVINLCDRVIVLFENRIHKELLYEKVNLNEIGAAMGGLL